MARNVMSNHTDMQDKYNGDCYDIHPIRSQYKGNHKRGGASKGRVTSFGVTAAGRHLCILASLFFLMHFFECESRIKLTDFCSCVSVCVLCVCQHKQGATACSFS